MQMRLQASEWLIPLSVLAVTTYVAAGKPNMRISATGNPSAPFFTDPRLWVGGLLASAAPFTGTLSTATLGVGAGLLGSFVATESFRLAQAGEPVVESTNPALGVRPWGHALQEESQNELN